MKIDIPLLEGNIISLDVVRNNMRARMIEKRCPHYRLTVDQALTELNCQDCGVNVNPIVWIADLAELFQALSYERKKLIEARARYEGKKRCRCEHCGKLTKVTPMSIAEVLKMRGPKNGL